ncbi:hypothetical protein MCP_1926 [Methanocella paludicola SANAE]|uniref:Archaeal Type IV pilin N-terminal domain-containing protein n=1 Tax=Methanocella paludicola (strain DSM 17711 / JCM 13418 / NBRC 101707 / SANAE) TaxID=304371 RepID=D1YZX6_METPS|nr:type IV pilin [Methanocella paludicola]BAI61998.1 hypothetical protein MCP_1926 [Methanocella paludicola SANAE]
MPLIIDDEGISDVLAVILIAALTIIIASIMASYAYGLAQDIRQPKNVVVTAQRVDTTTITLTNSGGDLEILDTTTPFRVVINDIEVPCGNLDENIGSTEVFNANAGAHVVVTAICYQETPKVIYDGIL